MSASDNCTGFVYVNINKTGLRKKKIFLRILRFEFKNLGVDLSKNYE